MRDMNINEIKREKKTIPIICTYQIYTYTHIIHENKHLAFQNTRLHKTFPLNRGKLNQEG